MTQLERFDAEKVEQILIYFIRKYSGEPEKTIEENLPVIPALLLSVVGDSWEKDINTFSTITTTKIGDSVNMILERFYNQTIDLVVVGLSNQNSSLSPTNIRKEIDSAMSVLVDANGKRIRTKTTSSVLIQIDFDKKYKKVLSDAHIIRIIKIEGEDYVEVVHDSLCAVIVKKELEKLTEGNVFISYTRKDEKWAVWLQNKLEHFKLPASLQKDNPNLPRTIRVLSDFSELIPGNLSEQLFEAIKRSRYLIVICSPRLVQSAWVNKEIDTFISMGRSEQIIPFIIEGDPYAKDPSVECFPQALRQLSKDKEILGVNVNETGKDAAVVRLIARMLNLRFDALWQKCERQRKRKILFRTILVFALFLFASSLGMWIINQPFNIEVRLADTSIHNEALTPYSSGVISLNIGDKVIKDTLSVKDGRSIITSIPRNYYNKDVLVNFESPYYYSVDTIISLAETLQLNIVRNPNIFGHIHFRLWDASNEMPVANCKITITNRSQDPNMDNRSFSIEAISDDEGLVNVIIPLEKQSTAYSIIADFPLSATTIYMPCGPDDVVLVE
jgi:hypothetical protein